MTEALLTQQIKTALDALKPVTAKVVGYYMGEITAQGFAEELLGNTPAVLLAYEGETRDEELSDETMSGLGVDIGRCIWRVYCVVEEPRSTGTALVGTPSTPGALELCGAVKSTLNRLRFDDPLAETIRSAAHLGYLDTRPALIVRGVLTAFMVRFALHREVQQATRDLLAGTVRLRGVDTNENVQPNGEHNPLVTTRNEFP